MVKGCNLRNGGLFARGLSHSMKNGRPFKSQDKISIRGRAITP
jgi:hypothetical protein